MSPRLRSLIASVVATVVIGGAVTDARAGAAGGYHTHAALASQSELLENYGKLTAALDTMATRESSAVEATLTKGRPTLLAFLDRGCVECLRMIPVVATLQKEFDPAVEVVVIDTDDKDDGFRKIYRRFAVWAGPAFVVLDRDGKTVERLIGPQPESSLRARVRSVAENHTPAASPQRRPSHTPAAIPTSPKRVSGTPTP